MKKYKPVLAAICLMLPLLCLAGCDVKGGVGFTDSLTSSDDGNVKGHQYNVDVNVDWGGFVISCWQSLENTFYLFATQTVAGRTISKAYQVLKDGTKKVIDDISNFLLDNNVSSISIETEPAVSVTGISLSPSTFECYFLGNTIKTSLEYHVLPSDATNQNVKFFSSNSSVCAVDGRGNLTITQPGSATISVYTVEGGYKAYSCLQIVDGKSLQKDTVEYGDGSDFNLTDSRYDENTHEQSSVYTAVATSTQTKTVLAVGTDNRADEATTGVLYYDIPTADNPSHHADLQIDQLGSYFSTCLSDVVYSDSSHRFYTAGWALGKRDGITTGLLASVEEVVSKDYSTIVQPKGFVTKASDNGDNIEYSCLATLGERIYAFGRRFYDSGKGIIDTSTPYSYSIMDIFDLDLNFISTSKVAVMGTVKNCCVNPYSGTIALVGTEPNENDVSENKLRIAQFDPNTNVTIYGGISKYANMSVSDVKPVSEESYVVTCNVAESASKTRGMIWAMRVSDGALAISQVKSVEMSADGNYSSTYASAVVVADGTVSLLGYATGTRKYDKWRWWIFADTVSWDVTYGIVVNFDSEMKYISSWRYVGAVENQGHHQAFLDGCINKDGKLVAVGWSNYFNSDNSTKTNFRYMQTDVKRVHW